VSNITEGLSRKGKALQEEIDAAADVHNPLHVSSRRFSRLRLVLLGTLVRGIDAERGTPEVRQNSRLFYEFLSISFSPVPKQ
jgi:hypothetical protein